METENGVLEAGYKFHTYLSGKISRIGFYITEYGCAGLYRTISMGLGLRREERGDRGSPSAVRRVHTYPSGKNSCARELLPVIN